jgi:predicted kinase
LPKNFIIVLVGPPCTGKSTFRQRLKQDFEFMPISSDDYIEEAARRHNTTYSKIFEHAVSNATKQAELDAKLALDSSLDVVWDQTNLTEKKRKKILDKFDNYVKICVYFEIEDSFEWMKRLYHRAGAEGKYIPYHIIDGMNRTYQHPVYSEGFDYVTDRHGFSNNIVKELIK